MTLVKITTLVTNKESDDALRQAFFDGTPLEVVTLEYRGEQAGELRFEAVLRPLTALNTDKDGGSNV